MITSPEIDDVITVSDSSALTLSGAMSISAWITLDSAMAGRPSTRLIVGKDRAGGVSGDAYSLEHDMTGGNDKLQFLIASNGTNVNVGSSQTLAKYTEDSSQSGWVLVTGVFQPRAFMRLYVDGVLDAELVGAAVPLRIDSVSTPFNIGRLHNSTSQSFAGGIDDVQIYSKALAAEEVAMLFAHPGQTIDQLAPLPADFILDGVVDGLDLARWKQSFGIDARADANWDGVSDGNDSIIWQCSVTSPPSQMAVLPEATSLAYVAITLRFWSRGGEDSNTQRGLGRGLSYLRGSTKRGK